MQDIQAAPHTTTDTGDMPVRIRVALWTVASLLIGGAVYLLAVRGEALLVDLSGMAGRFFCL